MGVLPWHMAMTREHSGPSTSPATGTHHDHSTYCLPTVPGSVVLWEQGLSHTRLRHEAIARSSHRSSQTH